MKHQNLFKPTISVILIAAILLLLGLFIYNDGAPNASEV